MNSDNVLILPGWLNAGPDHWQSRWQASHGYTRVEQHEWARPLRGDWIARLEDVVLAQPANVPITLVAHSLGCLLVAAWAALSRNTQRVKCAFLAAPCDVALEALRPVLASWTPRRLPEARPSILPAPPMPPAASMTPMLTPGLITGRMPSAALSLPFKSLLLASHTDPYCSFERAQGLAANWGSALVDWGDAGHLSAEPGLGEWPAGHALLLALQRGEAMHPMGNGNCNERGNGNGNASGSRDGNGNGNGNGNWNGAGFEAGVGVGVGVGSAVA